MNNPAYAVVMDIDGTCPPIKVVSGPDIAKSPDKESLFKTTAEFRKDFRVPEEKESLSECCKKQLQTCCTCSGERRKKCLEKLFPVVRTVKKYKWRSDLPNDLISGLTVGIMQLPQGMAYAMLAEMPPVVGLYMAFFPVLIYFIFGSSRHISMGTVAVVSLLTGSVVARFYNEGVSEMVASTNGTFLTSDPANVTVTMSTTTAFIDDIDEKPPLPNNVKIAIASSLCLLTGLVQILLGVFRMGFVTTYMSDALISGFTTGCAVHVFTSQVKYVFGLKIPRSDGMFQIIKTYAGIITHIQETNIPTLLTSAICIIIVYIVKVQINYRFKSKLKIPIPVELIVVILGTLLSYYLKFHDDFKIKVVGNIPAGLPKPAVPTFHGVSMYTTDVFIVAVVGFAQSVSLAAVMAKKHCYSFDANQELLAYGAGNVFGSFFSCYPFAASVSRSSVQESAGGRTQVASVFSAFLVLIVILVIGPLFESLPNCCLAAIIMVALRSMFLQVLELPKIWRTSAYDFFIWVVTFTLVVVLHVDYGLLIGLIFSFFTVVIRTQRARATSLQKVEEVQLYKDKQRYIKSEPLEGFKIVGFTAPLYYANGDMFVKQVYEVSGVKPEKLKKQMKKLAEAGSDEARRWSTMMLVTESSGDVEFSPNPDSKVKDLSMGLPNGQMVNGRKSSIRVTPLRYIIIDFTAISFIDGVGSKILKQIVEEYSTLKVSVLLACVNDEVWSVLDATGFLEKNQNTIFLTIDDAVDYAREQSTNDVITTKPPPRRPVYRAMMYKENNNSDAEETDNLLLTEMTALRKVKTEPSLSSEAVSQSVV